MKLFWGINSSFILYTSTSWNFKSRAKKRLSIGSYIHNYLFIPVNGTCMQGVVQLLPFPFNVMLKLKKQTEIMF